MRGPASTRANTRWRATFSRSAVQSIVADHPVNALVAQGDTVVAAGDDSFLVRETGKAGSSKWVYNFKLAGGQVQSYDQFNDPGLVEAFS